MRINPENRTRLRNKYIKALRASFVPADDSALSATAQTLDYRVTPLIYSRSILSCTGTTGTTGSVVKIRLP